ncbi:zinc finger CCHC domain-containing protein, partial [Salmonella enterica]
MAKGKSESSSGQKKSSIKEVTCFECKESGHYKSDCPKLKRDKKPKKHFKTKKSLMVTFDESESEDVDSDGEVQGLMAIVKDKGTESKEAVDSDSESEGDPDSDDENEVFASFSTSELKHALSDIMDKYNSLLSKHKKLKKNLSAVSKTPSEHEKIISDLKNDNHA